MKRINCCGSCLNMMTLAAGFQDKDPAVQIILVGHEAQFAAYLAFLETLNTYEADKHFSFPFQVNGKLPPSLIQVWSFFEGNVEQIAVIENLAIPVGFGE